ncbi:MAG: glycoside hydrolase family 97 protein, partial [Verrucomicrobiae bacterium]|nr:glycoside hydrolase family 97 protein [Verrucomicrobiae bacterium]NNJ87744.1 hypothetical protein [Akkermansiaceae bacterium]
MKIQRHLLFLMFTLFAVSPGNAKGVQSPDGALSVDVGLTDSGSGHFSVSLNGEAVVENSPLGIRLEESEFDFTTGLKAIKVRQRRIDERYTMLVGKRLERRDHCTESVHSFQNPAGERVDIVFRVYNDAVAFSYRVHNEGKTKVEQETSGFHFKSVENTWSMTHRENDEVWYLKKPVGAALEKSSLSFPVLVETKSKKWALISESNVSNYPLSSGRFKGNQIAYEFPNPDTAVNRVGPDFVSPWRVMILGDQLATIVESCVIDHLAPPTRMKDLSWIEPGITSFPWWGDKLANSSPDTLKKYMDLSAEMNWRFIEFDIALIGSPLQAIDKWKTVDWIKDVVDYGLERGVLCYGWDDVKNLDTPEKRADIFSKYNEFGVRGIKVDFIDSYTQESRKMVEELIQDAAKYKLMVSFHGAQCPRGFARTYPHVITYEAVKGSEHYLFNKRIDPRHNCTLPFTRNVLGSMDYTPVAFSTKLRRTTMAHELALSVVYESGWQALCDVPAAYLNSVAKDFLSQLENTWDETRFLDGYPGEYACIARRKGDKW